MRSLRSLSRRITRVLAWPLALLILFEEWGWDPLQQAMARLALLLRLRWVGERIERLPPYAALALFLLPSVLLIPVKLAALWLIGDGHAVLGTVLVIAAK